MTSLLRNHTTVLFQGDSVTDAGRTFSNPNGLGFGYAAIISEMMRYQHPEMKVNFINRGISGNRISDMADRWNEDCIQLAPDILTILIGINNTWRRFDSNEPTSAAQFEKTYRLILDSTIRNTRARIFLLSPFLLPINAERLSWREDLYEKIAVVEKMAREYGLTYIPLHKIFSSLVDQEDQLVSYWSGDGVHPTYAGHDIIAHELLKAFGEEE